MVNEEKIIINAIHDAIVNYDENKTRELCKKALNLGIDIHNALFDGLAAGMETVGELFDKKVYFMPEVIMCSDTLSIGLDLLKPHLKKAKGLRKIILGTVEGDDHDIGKNWVKMMFDASGFEVYDLGKNVSGEKFVKELIITDADFVAISIMMTSGILPVTKIISVIRRCKPSVKIILGGAPFSNELAKQCGADGFAENAAGAVREAIRLI